VKYTQISLIVVADLWRLYGRRREQDVVEEREKKVYVVWSVEKDINKKVLQ
jgi:hypothetical protein